MKPRLTVITITVADLERSLRFYRDGLGLPTEGIIGTEFEYGAVAFFDLQAGLKLALWPRTSLAHDTGLPAGTPSPTELSLGHNVASPAEVDAVMAQAQRAGAVIVKPAQKTFWGGYAGYFQDPDGHLWEIVWNPQILPLDHNTNRTVPPTHPGAMLREDFLPDYGLTVASLAEALDVSRQTINELLRERRALSPAMALRLARLFGNSPEFWLNAQRAVDLWQARNELDGTLNRIRTLHAA